MALASKTGRLLPALGLAMLAACARQTREIEAAPVEPGLFSGMSCLRLVKERARRSQALIFAGAAQDQVSADDSLRTLGIPTPAGTLFDGDREPEVARLKGELRAVNAQLLASGCIADPY
jgi:hypothetical protein